MMRNIDKLTTCLFPATLLIIGLVMSAGLPAAETLREQEQESLSSFEQYLKLAQQGDADAQYQLAKLYRDGKGVKQDDQQAVYWLRKAVLQNQADAQGMLGSMYADGRGVPRDFWQARRWWSWGAQMGNAEAQRLQVLYNSTGRMPTGAGGERTQGQDMLDDAELIRQYLSTAEQGDPDSQFRLAILYGEKDPGNYPEAWKWLKKSAEQGSADAQFCLGTIYMVGTIFTSEGKAVGVKKNVKLAMHWLNRSAAQGNVSAQSALEVINSRRARGR